MTAVGEKNPHQRNLLFISYAYPPSSSPGAVRLSRIVARINRKLFTPYVVTVGKRIAQRDGGLNNPLDESFVMRQDDPLAKVVSGAGNGGKKKSAKRWSLKSIAQSFIFPDRTIFWIARLSKLDHKVDDIAPSVIITSSPSLATHFVGRRLAKRTGAKWIAEFRDPVSWLPAKDSTSRFKRFLLAKIEKWVVRRADLTVTISDAFSEYFRSIYPDADIRTVANGAEVDEARIAANMTLVAQRDNEGPLIITHAGSLYGGVRNPAPLIAAAKQAQAMTKRPISLHFIGGDSHLAKTAAEEIGAADLVVAHGSLGHEETVKLTEQAHGLVALLHDDPVARIGIMSKFFDYVATGNPVMVVGEKIAMLGRIVEEERAGKSCEYSDVAGMADWITGLAEGTETMRPDALAICKKWSADTMAAGMIHLCEELVAEK